MDTFSFSVANFSVLEIVDGVRSEKVWRCDIQVRKGVDFSDSFSNFAAKI